MEDLSISDYSGDVTASQLLKELRAELGLSQEALARELGLTVSMIAKYETRLPPGPKFLSRMVRFCNERRLPKRSLQFQSLLGLSVKISAAANEPIGRALGHLKLARDAVFSVMKGATDEAVKAPLARALEEMHIAGGCMADLLGEEEIASNDRLSLQAEERVGLPDRPAKRPGRKKAAAHKKRVRPQKGSE
ncbi:MAG TPA: hypothetical protein DCY80_09315 [Solibacterales bacterium]|nr:hypothetical protein [Bryobacterales bacterium]